MASSPAAQIHDSSIDQAGISVVTATRDGSNSRLGAFYDTVTMAAGALVHVHPLSSTQFLAAFSRRWTAATPSSSGHGFFSSYTEDLAPSWFIMGSSGARTLIDSTAVVPVASAVGDRTLVDGASMAGYLYLLHSTTAGGLIQHFRVATAGRVVPVDEEVLPNLSAQGVSFDRGMKLDNSYLTVFGADDGGNIFMARKPWARVGQATYKSAKNGDGTISWEYGTGAGWDANPANATPEPGLNSVGPVSFTRWRRTHYLATVAAQGNNRVAQVYSQLPGTSWKKQGAPVALGSVADGSYLGGTLQLQPDLLASPDLINTPASETAIPYVTAQKAFAGAEHAIQVAWGLLQVPRQT